MEFLKPLSIFTLGFYSLCGILALMTLYMLFYGARCMDAWMKREPMPTDRVLAYLVIAAVLGLCIGSFVQGLAEIHEGCASTGQTVGVCFFQQISQ